MAIPRISRIDAVEPAPGLREKALVDVDRAPGSGELVPIPGSGPKAAAPAPERSPAPEPALLVLGSKDRPPRVTVPPESYAKIRYDQESQTVLIQIVNAATGEVVREIPPDAWPRWGNADLQLPKGTLVEKER